MKTDIACLETKLTKAAVKAFANPRIFVYEKLGIFWLAERLPGDGFYTFDSVGATQWGIRRLTAEVERIAQKQPRPA
jgi:hypothetical protein